MKEGHGRFSKEEEKEIHEPPGSPIRTLSLAPGSLIESPLNEIKKGKRRLTRKTIFLAIGQAIAAEEAAPISRSQLGAEEKFKVFHVAIEIRKLEKAKQKREDLLLRDAPHE